MDGNFFKNVKRTWKYIKPAKGKLIGYASVSIIEAIIGAILPLVGAKVILNITSGVINQLIFSAFLVLVMELVMYILYIFKGYLYQKIYQNTLIGLQTAVAKETLKLEVKEIDKETSGLFINRLNNDTQDISSMFMEYTYWTSYVVSNVGVLVAVYILNKYLFVYAIFTSICIFLINKKRLSKQYAVEKNLKS